MSGIKPNDFFQLRKTVENTVGIFEEDVASLDVAELTHAFSRRIRDVDRLGSMPPAGRRLAIFIEGDTRSGGSERPARSRPRLRTDRAGSHNKQQGPLRRAFFRSMRSPADQSRQKSQKRVCPSWAADQPNST